MTLLIAHRGLITGPDSSIENHPEAIQLARSLGYDVEIDLWFSNQNWYLGHDGPQHEISIDWLASIDRNSYLDAHHLWIHAKNIEALYQLKKLKWEGHLFYHQTDDVVITSTGYLWTYPGKLLTPLSVCVMPEWCGQLENAGSISVYGYCTDYVELLAGMSSS